jgi:hypothetical protein
MNAEILKTIREKGLLLEKDIYDLLGQFDDSNAARTFLEMLERVSGQKIITKSTLTKNFESVQGIFSALAGENKIQVEKTIVRLGLSLEISKEKAVMSGVGVSEGLKHPFHVSCFDTTVN